jgi:hypothetical protein
MAMILAFAKDGISIPISKAITAMTTSSSTSVKANHRQFRRLDKTESTLRLVFLAGIIRL